MGDHKYEPGSLEGNIPWGPFISILQLVQPEERPAAHILQAGGLSVPYQTTHLFIWHILSGYLLGSRHYARSRR